MSVTPVVRILSAESRWVGAALSRVGVALRPLTSSSMRVVAGPVTVSVFAVWPKAHNGAAIAAANINIKLSCLLILAEKHFMRA